MIAKRISVEQPKPPDRIILEMSLEEAEKLRGISFFTISIPVALEKDGVPKGEASGLLSNLYRALGHIGISPAWLP